MYEASDVANFFTNLCLDDAEDYITNQKLNNLMYFAQGWSLALRGRPLFSNEIQAWRYGPVIPAIYHEYRNCGNMPLTVVDDSYSSNVFSGEEYSLLLDIYAEYGRYTARALTEMTHEPKTPWSRFYEEDRNAVIPKKAIKEYFSSCPKLKRHDYSGITEKDIEGHFNQELGYYVLPSDDEDSSYDF